MPMPPLSRDRLAVPNAERAARQRRRAKRNRGVHRDGVTVRGGCALRIGPLTVNASVPGAVGMPVMLSELFALPGTTSPATALWTLTAREYGPVLTVQTLKSWRHSSDSQRSRRKRIRRLEKPHDEKAPPRRRAEKHRRPIWNKDEKRPIAAPPDLLSLRVDTGPVVGQPVPPFFIIPVFP